MLVRERKMFTRTTVKINQVAAVGNEKVSKAIDQLVSSVSKSIDHQDMSQSDKKSKSGTFAFNAKACFSCLDFI